MVEICSRSIKIYKKEEKTLINLINTQNFYSITQVFQTMMKYKQESSRVCTMIIMCTQLAIKASKHYDNCTLGNLISNMSPQSLIISILDVLNNFINT